MLKAGVELLSMPQIRGKRFFVRCDLNFNLKDLERWEEATVTIRFLILNGAKVIVGSHRGTQKMRCCQSVMSTVVGSEVVVCAGWDFLSIIKQVNEMEEGDILLLENFRLHEGEMKNDPLFCSQLASLADVYVNEAFGFAHRLHASMVGLPRLLKPALAGISLLKELNFLESVFDKPLKPVTVVLGSNETLELVNELLMDKVDNILVGVTLASIFFQSQMQPQICNEVNNKAKRILKRAEKKKVYLGLPPQVLVLDEQGNEKVIISPQAIEHGLYQIIDVAGVSIATYAEILSNSRTIMWNGNLGTGYYDQGSRAILSKALAGVRGGAKVIMDRSNCKQIVKKAGIKDRVVLTSNFACAVQILVENDLPAIEALTVHDDVAC